MQKRIAQGIAATLILALAGCTTPPRPGPGNAAPADPPPPSVEQQTAPPQQEQSWRYPAYQLQQGERRWGYVDGSGAFVVDPQFEVAEEFGPDSLAVVYQVGKAGLIDLTGAVVLPVEADFITLPTDGIRIAYYEDTAKAIDASGKVLFESAELTGRFGDGLAPFARGGLYGYLNTTGAVAIAPRYAQAGSFTEGRAVVQLPAGRFAVIDTEGNEVRELAYSQVAPISEGIVAVQEPGTLKWGYLSLSGDLAIPGQFIEARPFSGGLAVVNAGESYAQPRYGVIDRQGRYVIPPRYGDIQELGEGLFAVAQPQEAPIPSQYAPRAIFTADGQPLTDFLYYDVVPTPVGLSVTDGTETYFLDRKGRRATDLPSAAGVGTMRAVGDLIAMQIDGTLGYVTRDGNAVWQAAETWPLAGGASVVTRKHRRDRFLLVRYPELTGLPDARVQAAINQRLKELFLGPGSPAGGGDGEVKESIQVGFAVQQVGHVLVVERTGSIYPLGAAHGMPLMSHYHFDLDAGAEYQLSDLFRPESGYTDRLRQLVRQQIEAGRGGVSDPNPAVRPDQPFAAGPDDLMIYWSVYEIGPYAAGFPSFHIPYAEVRDLIDTEGAFWKALGLPGI